MAVKGFKHCLGEVSLPCSHVFQAGGTPRPEAMRIWQGDAKKVRILSGRILTKTLHIQQLFSTPRSHNIRGAARGIRLDDLALIGRQTCQQRL